MYLRNGKVGIYDLSSNEFDEQDLPEGDNLDSLKIAERLGREHGPEPVILGSGALTASFVPAACAGFAIAGEKMMPILGFAGVELKFSGFDFVVVKGRAERQGYLWIRDGVIEFVDAEWMASLDSWKRVDKIRGDQGDGKIQVISTGPWGDSSRQAAQAVIDYWGGEDKVGIGAELGKRRLNAIAFRGMGEVDLKEPEKHFEDAILLMNEHVQRLGKSEGLKSYAQIASRDDFGKLVHRIVACYGCPHPCRSYLKVSEVPTELRLASKEPGYLHYDIPGLTKAFELGFNSVDATLALMKCAKAGAEPVAALSAVSSASLAELDGLLSKPTDIPVSKVRNFEAAFDNANDYRSAVGLGVCPRYWSKAGFDINEVASYAKSAMDLEPI